MDYKNMLANAISPYDNYCDGYGNLGSSGNNYILGFGLSVGKVKKQFSHAGSKMLDEINAFDTAEIQGPYLGQINMSTVSSFCGLNGMVWGMDIAPVENLFDKSNFEFDVSFNDETLPVFSVDPLIDRTEDLFGNVDQRKYPLLPGAHVPCANKSIKLEGPGYVYVGVAFGIPADRTKSACLIMEDVGYVKDDWTRKGQEYVDQELKSRLCKSVLQVGLNQRVKYEKILVGIRTEYADHDEIVCGLIAAPYFTIAKDAISEFKLL